MSDSEFLKMNLSKQFKSNKTWNITPANLQTDKLKILKKKNLTKVLFIYFFTEDIEGNILLKLICII